MSVLRLATLACPVERTENVAAWQAKLHRWASAAKAGGADMLLLPEYAGVELGAAAAPGTEVAAELRAVLDLAPAMVAAAVAVARDLGLWLCPGSLPVRVGARVLNQAPLIAPAGSVAITEKHCMTRFEAEEWHVDPGTPPAPIATPWGLVGIAICYDVEFPPLTRRLATQGAFLILVPACTDTEAGAARVEISARACALQNQCFVAVAPTVGDAPWCGALDTNRGRAAVFGPIDRGFAEHGVIAAGPPDTPGLVFATLDPALLHQVREDGAVRNFRDWPQWTCTP
jgi:predicted amidohydrolase